MSKSFKFDAVSELEDSQLWLGKSFYLPRDSEELHDHDFYELVIVQSGLGWHLFEDEKFYISAGNVFIVSPGAHHGYKSVENLKLYNLLFRQHLFDKLVEDLRTVEGFQMLFLIEPGMDIEKRKQGNLRVDELILPQIVDSIENMYREQEERRPGFRAALKACCLKIILEVSRNCKIGNGKYYHHAQQISRVISFMEKNYTKELNLETLAEYSKLSVGTFRRLFKEAAGCSPINYLLQLRLRKAAIMLSGTFLSVTEIAFQAGFNDSNYFSHQFCKAYGLSPSAYRIKKRA